MGNAKKIVLAGILLISAVGSAFCALSEDEIFRSIGSGVLASIIASFVFSFISEIWNDDEKKEQKSNIDQIKRDLNKIGRRETALDKAFSGGLEQIELIDYADESDNLWIDLLEKADSRLDIIAHTLHPWFKDEYADKFSSQIIKILMTGKKVRILILDPEGDNLEYINTVDPKGYRRKIETSISELRKIYNSVDPSVKKNLIVKDNGCYVIPYTYIRNDINTYISPYLCANATRSSFIAICKCDSRIAKGFNEDFDEIFNSPSVHEVPLDIPSTTSIELVSGKINKTTNNCYQSQTWNTEDTTRYVFKITRSEGLVEAGYYIHYKDGTEVEKVIELSTSCGCTYGCKYCASSKIAPITPLTSEEMMQMLECITDRAEVPQSAFFTLALTGSGDYSKTFENVNRFLAQAKIKYTHCNVILSSCAWDHKLKKCILQLVKDKVEIRFLQWTYISSNIQSIAKVIPFFSSQHTDQDIKSVIKEFYSIAKLRDKFRINYLMIKDINDSKSDFESFVNLLVGIGNHVLVRIAELNKTSASTANNLLPAERSKLHELRSMCIQAGITAYVYYAEENDNMNCGQLITDSNLAGGTCN